MINIFLNECSDNIDGERYYYETYLNCSDDYTIIGVEVRLTLRGINPESTIVFDVDDDDVRKWIDKKVAKIVEQHYKAYVNYKGEVVEDVNKK